MGGWSRDDTLRSGAPGPTFAAAIGPYFGPIWAHVRLGYSTFAHEADRLSYVDATVGAMPVLVAYEPVILRIGGDVGVSCGSAVVSLDCLGKSEPTCRALRDKITSSSHIPTRPARAALGAARDAIGLHLDRRGRGAPETASSRTSKPGPTLTWEALGCSESQS